MATVDKNQAMIDYLITCPYFPLKKIYFNFMDINNGVEENLQFTVRATDKSTNRTYIDGSVLKKYTLDIIDFKSIGENAIIKTAGYPDENVSNISETQQILDWIDAQEELHNYPNFGANCEIQSIGATSNTPNADGIYMANAKVATYKVTITVTYLDTSKCIWNS